MIYARLTSRFFANGMKGLVLLALIATCGSCARNSETEKYQHKRNNTVNVHAKVQEIKIEDVFIHSVTRLKLSGDYIFIIELKSPENLLHIFDRNTFRHIASALPAGQGPGEITVMLYVATDEARRRIYVTDSGKRSIFDYDLDSLLAHPSSYLPEVKARVGEKQIPHEYLYINDTLCIGSYMNLTGYSDFKQSVGRWNMITGEITPMKYTHPAIEEKRILFAASAEEGIYVECYPYHDLMTICTLNGELKYNIYGPDWDSQTQHRHSYYGPVVFCGSRIITVWHGGEKSMIRSERGMEANLATRFLVFDMDGNYLRTLETGYRIMDFCYDRENNRLIISMDDEIQFAYLDLDGLI
jgi:hypothetical protein